ncbi:polysaccharide biosynthesis protein [Vibrio parahaemolyticus]|uniref:PssD/Cps14F family polysaccharide biosynthesis glycosyltransferase n=1 Tax=Vibrio parahaemolyticus TaxID=670 RepID=UPI000813B62B|nr:PssD/Cps14F family polysaccharide biosynthesis glycosyltransferase [Vibrio parahaemolyticus]MDF4380897.1 PssD/Cps14F family polysaccharide biosynthesis glycosyltransferase [Vibrio parahaemolyticus]MDF4390165.1 PssD/Cps14F family polysaccharide biosynthesis glycosyltransferase [Vibrio parahaemolyticus]MDF5284032.1 PssD/Cps14F family polysaccharide biosynthesis glycosyltransferase [Vibrio parahaemolyticus]OCP97487.1 polysaccharide biosynthesis protein [Vibrio parahaemolyticus]
MSTFNNKTILVCFGEGGHEAQANRLVNNMLKKSSDIDFISISDVKEKPIWSKGHYVVGEVRDKYSHLKTICNSSFFSIFKALRKISNCNEVKCVISTGPGISVLVACYFRFIGVKVIHIETWSRFESKSFTGRIMHLLANKFYVQNHSLLNLYKNSIYSGRL